MGHSLRKTIGTYNRNKENKSLHFFYNTDVLSQDTAATTAPIIVTTALPTTTSATTATSPTESATTLTPSTEPATTATSTTEPAITDNPTTQLPSGICGGPERRRVAFINMSDPNQDCPQGLNLTDYSIRSCGRAHTEGAFTGSFNCSSVTFPVDSEYSRVCGRATAYRWGYNDGFWGYNVGRQNIDGQYVNGLSLTHGSPRTHIWTFASGLYNGTSGDIHGSFRCPCDPGNTYGSPPFIENDYFCDSVATVDNWQVNHPRFFPNNALWDGQDLLNPCYGLNNPPWFNKTLPVPTTDDIELRMCFADHSGSANIGINLLEVYIY